MQRRCLAQQVGAQHATKFPHDESGECRHRRRVVEVLWPRRSDEFCFWKTVPKSIVVRNGRSLHYDDTAGTVLFVRRRTLSLTTSIGGKVAAFGLRHLVGGNGGLHFDAGLLHSAARSFFRFCREKLQEDSNGLRCCYYFIFP